MKNATVIHEQGYKTLSLSPNKVKDLAISPKIKDGKIVLDKNNPKHRYL